MASTVQFCEAAHLVALDISFLHTRARALKLDDEVKRCDSYYAKLIQMTNEKLDATTAHLLQYADEFLDPTGKGEVKLACASGQIKVGLWMNLVPKGLRNKKIDFSELEAIIDVPKPVVMQALAVRLVHLPYDINSMDTSSQNIDHPLGGIFCIDLLKIPAPPKRARGWIMREITAEPNYRLDYPLEGTVATAALAIKVSIRLPSNVILPPNPRVGWWDPSTHSWSDEGISDVLLHEDTNQLYFNTLKLTHLAVLQRRNVNHIKHCWSIKSTVVTENTSGATCAAQLILRNDMYHKIHFEVTDIGVRLVSPSVKPLESLNATYLPPHDLLTRLTIAGINLTPSLVDDARFGVVPKLSVLEEKVISELLELVAAFEVSSLSGEEEGEVSPQWESWSSSPRRAVFSVKEIVWPMTGDTEAAPSVIEQKIHILAEVDPDTEAQVKFRIESISDNPYDTYVHLKHALSALSTPDAKDRMANSNLLFEFYLLKMLRLLRLFSYTQPPKHRVVEVTTRKNEKIDEKIAQDESEHRPPTVPNDEASTPQRRSARIFLGSVT
ncbi:hypothetical protein AC1031_002719 [Aphanomyces cochlioides]|nr:hypothetical protein AC1031_002719 [Aphanomyces cochlioides]